MDEKRSRLGKILKDSATSSEQNQDRQPDKAVLCPYCGGELKRKLISGQGLVYAHKVKGKCNATFRTIKEIEEAEPARDIEAAVIEEKPQNQPENDEENKQVTQSPDEPPIVATMTMEEYQSKYPNEFKNEEDDKMKALDKDKISSRMEEISEDDLKSMKQAVIVHKISSQKNTDEKKESSSKNRLEDNKAAAPARKKESEPAKNSLENNQKPDQDDDFGKTQVLAPPEAKKEKSSNGPYLINTQTGEIISIDSPVFKIGKNKSCDLRLQDNKAVSRTHATLYLKNDTCYIKDLNSTNGTKVGEFKIPPETEVEVKNGVEISIADEIFTFSQTGEH